MLERFEGGGCTPASLDATAAKALVRVAVRAFFEQDLLAAARQLLANAIGSFGLVLSTSLDAPNELVVAARGQTMSIAFYPKLGCFLFGSESAATKAAMMTAKAGSGSGSPAKVAPSGGNELCAPGLEGGFRFDLDDGLHSDLHPHG